MDIYPLQLSMLTRFLDIVDKPVRAHVMALHRFIILQLWQNSIRQLLSELNAPLFNNGSYH